MDNSIWFALIILAGVMAIGISEWLDVRREQKTKRKIAASKPIDHIDFYDSKGNVKQQGYELREITYRRRKR